MINHGKEMSYFLNKNVTDDMLISLGFKIIGSYEIRAVKPLKSKAIFIEGSNEVVAWDKKDIQYLLDLGYVEEKK